MPLITGMFQSSRITSGMLASQRVERLAPVLGLVDGEVERLQDVAGDLADHLAIVDDQTASHIFRSVGPWPARVSGKR